MKRRLSITFELREDGRYDSLALRLRQFGAILVMPTQWILLTSLTAGEIRRDLEACIDPADRLLVTQVSAMSFRNLIGGDELERGAA